MAELLPWLVNGTLAADEELTVTEHLERCDICSRELMETIEASVVFSAHVPSETLVEYSQGLEPRELRRDEIEHHLRSCATCREDLELVSGPSNVVDFAQAKRRFLGLPSPPALGRRLALAAAVALIALGGWALSLYDGSSAADLAVAEHSPGTVLETPAAPDDAQVFKNGFESGLGTWQAAASFDDSFESGKIDSSWTVYTSDPDESPREERRDSSAPPHRPLQQNPPSRG